MSSESLSYTQELHPSMLAGDSLRVLDHTDGSGVAHLSTGHISFSHTKRVITDRTVDETVPNEQMTVSSTAAVQDHSSRCMVLNIGSCQICKQIMYNELQILKCLLREHPHGHLKDDLSKEVDSDGGIGSYTHL